MVRVLGARLTPVSSLPVTRVVRVAALRPGDKVLSDSGLVREVKAAPSACQARGYVYVQTDGAPINCHKDNEVRVVR